MRGCVCVCVRALSLVLLVLECMGRGGGRAVTPTFNGEQQLMMGGSACRVCVAML